MIRILTLLVSTVLWCTAPAKTLLPQEKTATEKLDKLYHGPAQNPTANVSTRLEQFSRFFLNKPYILNALGEGANADFDQNPRFRFDGFDCETYVTTVIALSLSRDTKQFIALMKMIRYQNDEYSYLNRHHFTDLDWNKNNQSAGIIKDITDTIHDANHKPVAKLATTKIDKSAWIQQTAAQRANLPNIPAVEKQEKIQALIHNSKHIPICDSSISYIPLTQLFTKTQQPVSHLWRQIPNGAIIEIIRPDWPLKKKIGTNLNVSHLGFAFWRNNVLWFRHASQIEKKVVELPLEDYLRDTLGSPTIKGINIQIVVDKPFPRSTTTRKNKTQSFKGTHQGG